MLALEREQGVTLLEHGNRRFSLNQPVSISHRQGMVLTQDLDRVCEETAHGDDFSLRIGYLRGYGGADFQRAVAEFSAKYPDFPIEMESGNP